MNTKALTKAIGQWQADFMPHPLSFYKPQINIQESDSDVFVSVTLPFPCETIKDDLAEFIQSISPKEIHGQIQSKITTHKVQGKVKTLPSVKNVIAIASGKGGVGKSTVSCNLAIAMAQLGAKVGLLDADLYGPSQPMMMGIDDKEPKQVNKEFIPIHIGGVDVISMGFWVKPDQAVVWRGPMISQALQQLFFQTHWEDLDYLFIDLPPGTGDIQLTLSQKFPVTGAVIVTTPQDIALLDARKAIDMFHKVDIPILGLVENMATHICSQCGHTEAIFGHDGGKILSEELDAPLLGQLPLDIHIRLAMDTGNPFQLQKEDSNINHIFQKASLVLALELASLSKDYSRTFPNIVLGS